MKKGEVSPPDRKAAPQPLLRKESSLREESFMGNQRKDSKVKVVAAMGATKGPPDDSLGTFLTSLLSSRLGKLYSREELLWMCNKLEIKPHDTAKAADCLVAALMEPSTIKEEATASVGFFSSESSNPIFRKAKAKTL
jgi:hypothetical protein